MAILFKQFKLNFISLIPILLLFIISLNGNSVIDFRFFSVNIHYILIYFWVLRRPQLMGIGYIFLSGIITDVVLGLPIGTSSLTLLVIAGVAAYVRVVTVRVSLGNDWLSFIPALLIANFVYFLVLYFSNYPINYLYLFNNSIFTLFFYPVLWMLFSIIIRFTE
tara:strand:- start:226 stop:717 length:492 start_codon:yes stop_codon:yes gene_type:complete